MRWEDAVLAGAFGFSMALAAGVLTPLTIGGAAFVLALIILRSK